MNQKKIVIASVLKPVNDSRNYEKTAISINKSGNYQVYLVGQKVREVSSSSTIYFDPLFSFSRLSFRRFFAGWIFLRYLFRRRPDMVIVATFELLLPAVIYKILKGGKLVYDVQENYFRNLVYTSSFPPVIKHLLAVGVRGFEYITRPWVDQYLLAEKNYEKEFSFSRNKSIILENKLPESSVMARVAREDDTIQLLYTGTIAENYGVFEAVGLAEKMHAENPRIRLVIAGFAPRKTVLEKLKERIRSSRFIVLKGGDQFIPHAEILQLVASSDVGLIAYRPDKSTENCIPTKLYEYIAHQLPYLIGSNVAWQEITALYQAGMEIDYQNPAVNAILERLTMGEFYTALPGTEIYWEEKKISSMLQRLLGEPA